MSTTPRPFLISFDYLHQCQVVEWARDHLMIVYAVNFQQACQIVKSLCKLRFPEACNFKNRTLG